MSKPKGLGAAMKQVASMDQLAAMQAALDDDSDIEDYVPPPRKPFIDSDDEDMMLDKGKDSDSGGGGGGGGDDDDDDDDDDDKGKENEKENQKANQENVAKGGEGEDMDTEEAGEVSAKKNAHVPTYKIGDMSRYYSSTRWISVHGASSAATNSPMATYVLEALGGFGDDVEAVKMILGSDAIVAKLKESKIEDGIVEEMKKLGMEEYVPLERYGGLLFMSASFVRDPEVSSLLFSTLDELILDVCKDVPHDVFYWFDCPLNVITLIREYLYWSLVSMGFNYHTPTKVYGRNSNKPLMPIKELTVLKLHESVYTGVSDRDASISDRVMRYLPHSLLFRNAGGGNKDISILYMQMLLLLNLEPSLNEICKNTIQETFHAWFHNAVQRVGWDINGEVVDKYQVGVDLLVSNMTEILRNREHEEVVFSTVDASVSDKQASAILAASWLSMSDSPLMIKALAIFLYRHHRDYSGNMMVEGEEEDESNPVDKIMLSLLSQLDATYRLKSSSDVSLEVGDAMYIQSILTLTSAYLACLSKYPPYHSIGNANLFSYSEDYFSFQQSKVKSDAKQTMSKEVAKVTRAVDAIEEEIVHVIAKNKELNKQENGVSFVNGIKKSVEYIALMASI
jgi:hypothetical protein